MKNAGRGKDRIGNGAKDGLLFTWGWFKSGTSNPGPCQICETLTPHQWHLTVEAWASLKHGYLYHPIVCHMAERFAHQNTYIMAVNGVGTRLDAQRLAESTLEALLADSLRDCFGYQIEIHHE